MSKNKYITLTAIPSHEQRDCNQDTERCYCDDIARIVFTKKDRSGHYIYRQKVLTAPDWNKDKDGYVKGNWYDTKSFVRWLATKMDEFESELKYDYETINARDIIYGKIGEEGDKSISERLSEWQWC